MKRKMIPEPLRVPGSEPKTEFEAFDALATKLLRTPKLEAKGEQAKGVRPNSSK